LSDNYRPGFLGYILISWLVLITAGCSEEPPKAEPVIRPVKIAIVGNTGAEGERELPGTIKATQHAEMAFEVAGRILEFRIKEGQDVPKGKVLALLDDRDYKANFEKASANLRLAQADLERAMSVYREDKGAIAQTQIDSYQRGVEVAQAELNKQQKAVEDTLLRAPFAGRLARRLVDDFQNVQAKEPVLILQDLSLLEVEVSVPERDVVTREKELTSEAVTSRIKPLVIATAVPDRSFPARIKEFATTADPVTRTFQARLIFDNPRDVQILPGMTAKIRYQVLNEGVVKLPVNATFADAQGKPHVWKVDPQSMQVSKVAVQLGQLTGDSVAVTGGLNVDEQIAVSGVHHLREGMKVSRFTSTANKK